MKLPKFLNLSYYWNGYDAVNPSVKRRDSGQRVASSDELLSDYDRRKLMETGRDSWRNFPVAGWAIRKHLDYVSSFNFMAKTGSKEGDRILEEFVAKQSLPGNAEVTRKHSLASIIRLAELRRVIDGDLLLIKTRGGYLQAVEGDRIRTPGSGIVEDNDNVVEVHGVVVSPAGTPKGYKIYKKYAPRGSYTYETTVPAVSAYLHGYYDSFDQIRGVSPIASALTSFQDVMEVHEYARLKAKVTQLFAMLIKSDTPEYRTDDGGCADYKVDFGKGPLKLRLQPGDDAEFLESKHPSTEFQTFMELTMNMALKALDIPWSFFDESHTNYFGSRSAVINYLQSCRSKRASNIALLNWWTDWQIKRGQMAGLLPKGELSYKWNPIGIEWWDPSKEIQADALAVANKFKTRSEIRMERYGDTWTDVVDRIAEEDQYLIDLGLSPSLAVPGAPQLQEESEPEEPESESQPEQEEAVDEQ